MFIITIEKTGKNFTLPFFGMSLSQKYQGIVTENHYNKANSVVKTVHYYQPIEASDYVNWTADKITALIIPHQKDRTVSHWYDTKKQLRFTVNQAGLVNEKRYDLKGQVITDIIYAHPLAEYKTTQDLAACCCKEY